MKEQIANLKSLQIKLDFIETDIQHLVADCGELNTPERESFRHRVVALLDTCNEMRENLINVLNMYDTFKTEHLELE